MTSLSSQYVQNSYGDLLQVSNSGSGVDAITRTVSDGGGTSSALQLSTTKVNVNGTFQIGGYDFMTSGAYTCTLTLTGNTAITFPTSGTVVTTSATQTLTNKTLTTPIISSISNTGTLTLPTSSDTLVGRDTTDTLTNKTLTTPTITSPTISSPTVTSGTFSSPTLTTPVLGVATATSINGLALTSSTGTLTIANGKTLTASNTLTFTGTDSSSVAFGAGGTVMYTSTALANSQLPSGAIVQVQSVLDNTTTAQTSIIPADNTPPQNTEGTQLVTLSITPTNASNILLIEAAFPFSCSANIYGMLALFQDSTASALAAAMTVCGGTDQIGNIILSHRMTAGTTSSTTFKLRFGPGSAGTCNPNGNSSFNLSNSLHTVFKITEIKA